MPASVIALTTGAMRAPPSNFTASVPHSAMKRPALRIASSLEI
jgi:hypothetical protein